MPHEPGRGWAFDPHQFQVTLPGKFLQLLVSFWLIEAMFNEARECVFPAALANQANERSCLVRTGRGEYQLRVRAARTVATYVAEDVLDAAKWIVSQH